MEFNNYMRQDDEPPLAIELIEFIKSEKE